MHPLTHTHQLLNAPTRSHASGFFSGSGKAVSVHSRCISIHSDDIIKTMRDMNSRHFIIFVVIIYSRTDLVL